MCFLGCVEKSETPVAEVSVEAAAAVPETVEETAPVSETTPVPAPVSAIPAREMVSIPEAAPAVETKVRTCSISLSFRFILYTSYNILF